jgi:prepilin-type N-terminal cleavage/methylation domain-containing protein
MRPSLHTRIKDERHGVSLIELLVVIVIVLLVSTITMRNLAPALANRNLREGARMLNVVISSACNRAIRTGRPGGIWIEKIPGMPEAAQTIFTCAVPEPYSGDFSDSQLEAYTYPDWNDPLVRTTAATGRYFYNIVAPSRASIAGIGARGLDSWASPDPKKQRLVEPGDLIRINRSGIDYPLYTVDTLDPAWASVPQLQNGAQTGTRSAWIIGVYAQKDYLVNSSGTIASLGSDRVTRGGSSPFQLYPFPNTLSTTPFITPGSTPTTKGQTVPYQIFRKPRKLAAGAVTLPDSVVIDLNYSVIEDFPLYPRPWSLTYSTTTASFAGGSPVAPAGGPIGNDDRIISTTNTNPNYDMRPIIITFAANGSVDKVYCTQYVKTLGKWTWAAKPLGSQIHLLVGKAEKVPCDPNTKGQDGITAQTAGNLADLDNFWVNVTPTNGSVTTNPNQYTSTALTLVTSGTLSGAINVRSAVMNAHNLGETGLLMGGK